MSLLVNLYNRLLFGMAYCSGVTIFIAVALIVMDVGMRVSGLDPFVFVLTTVEYILLYFTMLAAPWLVRIKGHVFIDAVTQFMPPAVKKVIAKLVYLACIIASSIYCYQLIQLLTEAIQSGELDMRSYEIPIWILFVPMPLCFFMCAMEFMRYLIGIDDMYTTALEDREGV